MITLLNVVMIDKLKELFTRKKKVSDGIRNNMKIFELFGDETRIKIISYILKSNKGEMTIDEITNKMYLSRPAISHHIKKLYDAGLLKMREESRYNYYSLNKDSEIWDDVYSFINSVSDLLDAVKKTDNV